MRHNLGQSFFVLQPPNFGLVCEHMGSKSEDSVCSRSLVGVLSQLRLRTQHVSRGKCSETLLSRSKFSQLLPLGNERSENTDGQAGPTNSPDILAVHHLRCSLRDPAELRQQVDRLIAENASRATTAAASHPPQPSKYTSKSPAIDIFDPNEWERIGAASDRRQMGRTRSSSTPFPPTSAEPPRSLTASLTSRRSGWIIPARPQAAARPVTAAAALASPTRQAKPEDLGRGTGVEHPPGGGPARRDGTAETGVGGEPEAVPAVCSQAPAAAAAAAAAAATEPAALPAAASEPPSGRPPRATARHVRATAIRPARAGESVEARYWRQLQVLTPLSTAMLFLFNH